ncbi:TIGR03086 family metal-binding protein [Kitasatospora sp. NPDC088391]|uniref:TIGR03086 family metal-binding protein n=1 Tax=Kitasatospora sp. NPDC088391 TaxID=3364074 RepID=UPI00380BB678
MSTQIAALLRAAADRTVPLVEALPDGGLGAPTPCGEYDVRGLVRHLWQVVVNFRELAAKREVDWSLPAPELAGDWRGRFAADTDALVAAWAEPGADEGTTGAMALPAVTVGGMVLLDLTVHGWDLARATGLPYGPAPEAVAALGPLTAELAPTARTMGMFDEPVGYSGDDPFAALLALTGRDAGRTA